MFPNVTLDCVVDSAAALTYHSVHPDHTSIRCEQTDPLPPVEQMGRGFGVCITSTVTCDAHNLSEGVELRGYLVACPTG